MTEISANCSKYFTRQTTRTSSMHITVYNERLEALKSTKHSTACKAK